MITDEQVQHLKQTLEEELERIKERPDNDEVFLSTELSNYDNHPADQATDLQDQATELAMDNYHEHQVSKIANALRAIDEGTYGICSICGEDIPYERLEAVPTALTCVEHAENTAGTQERPVEEDIISASTSEPNYIQRSRVDDDDLFLEVEEFGSSDTPADKGYS